MQKIRAFLCGSGLGAFSEPAVVDRLLAMITSPKGSAVKVVYLGTATYDLPSPQATQTALLLDRGCDVHTIAVADPSICEISEEDARVLKEEADVVLVSGGNTLYAVRRWEETGLDAALKAAAESGVVLAGGSAGAICWFSAGHSDSADPSTFLKPMLLEAAGRPVPEDSVSTSWSYIRVHGLGLLPGMLCPHFDVTESNGVRREEDFTKMVKRHCTERGVALDHWATLILPGDGTYEVFAAPGKKRTLPDNEKEKDDAAAATPGVFIIDVEKSVVDKKKLPASGKLEDVLRAPSGPVVRDPFEMLYAMKNPTPSSGQLIG